MATSPSHSPPPGASPPGSRIPGWDALRELFPGDAVGGVVLIACAAIAMAWANSPWATTYFGALHTSLPLQVGPLGLRLSLLHWINDLVMAVFFLVVGLEIKREFVAGELADLRRAALPIAGALGGMLVPAAIYAAFNAGGPGARGWGIPMATDIAFSLGVLALLGPRVPRGLTVFLAALAIVDDLGAVSVIAIFYTAKLNLGALSVALAIVVGLAFLARLGVMRLSVYLAAAPVLWWFMFQSGVHATIAGVLLGFVIPLGKAGDPHIADSPLESLEHALKPWITWLVMPVFALANAGVAMSGMTAASLAQPIAAGCALGLLVGKPIGIFAVAWLAVRSGLAALPRGADWGKLWGVAMIAGIGFTMSLFVASLSFRGGDGGEDLAKLGVLLGSLLSGVLGTWVLGRALAPRAREAARPALVVAVIAAGLAASALGAVAAGTAGTRGARPATLAAAERDSLRAVIEQDRRDTDDFLRTNPNSALGTFARVPFGRPAHALVVGSAPTCDLVLDDASVRAQHVRIAVAGDSFHVAALDPGATFLAEAAGRRDTTAATLPASWIGVGRYRVRLSHQNAPALIACDPDRPAKAAYPGSDWWPIDFAYRFVAALEPDPAPDTLWIESTNSPPRASLRAGWFRFVVAGKEQKLAAVRLLEPGVPADDVSVFFRDATGGKGSYGLGRYVDPPRLPDGRYVLDFNLAYNPTCALSPHYNCPVPPAENRLGVAIEAGEAYHRHDDDDDRH
jgi:NhaA family Na+:H+ antiporter